MLWSVGAGRGELIILKMAIDCTKSNYFVLEHFKKYCQDLFFQNFKKIEIFTNSYTKWPDFEECDESWVLFFFVKNGKIEANLILRIRVVETENHIYNPPKNTLHIWTEMAHIIQKLYMK